MRRAILVTALLLVTLASGSTAFAQPAPEFKLGFKALADQIPDVVGQPTEVEHYGPNGDSLQKTATGLMVWRKADNWTVFTNGSRTWLNGLNGLEARANDERLTWESDYPKAVTTTVPGSGAIGSMTFSPNFASDATVFATRAAVDAGYSHAVLYRSKDGGRNWDAVPSSEYPGVSNLVFSPAFSQDHTIFATGIDATVMGGAVLKSTDGGSTWKAVGPTAQQTVVPWGLAISPNFAVDHTVLATWSGSSNVEMSTDGGATWKWLQGGIGNRGTAFGWPSFSPGYAQDRTIYIGGREGSTGLWASRDAGANWQEVGEKIPRAFAGPYVLSPNFASEGIAVAKGNNPSSPPTWLYRTTDGGKSWTEVAQGGLGDIVLSPKFASNGVIYFGGGVNGGAGTLVSTDGGSEWREAFGWWFDASRATLFAFTPDGTQLWAGLQDGNILRLPLP